MRFLKKLQRISWTDRGLLVEAAFLTVVVRLCLDLLPFRLWQAWLIHRGPAVHDGLNRDAYSITARCAWAARVASRCFPRSDTCLVHAVVVQKLLHHRGLDASIRIGVARGAERQFEAHAWVESEGRVVIGDDPHQSLDVRFQPLTQLTSRA